MPHSYMKAVNEKAMSAAEERAKTERNIINKFLPLLQSEAAKTDGADVEKLIAAFHRIVVELQKANTEVKQAIKGRAGVPFPTDLVPELLDVIKTETKTDEALHLFIRKLAMRTGYDKSEFTSYRGSIVAYIETTIKERFLADAIVGGKLLLDTKMAMVTFKSTLDRTIKRIATAYAKVCDDEDENQAVKLKLAQMQVDKPTTTLAQASAAYFTDIEMAKAAAKEAARKSADDKRKAAAEAAAVAAAAPAPAPTGPPPVDMPEDIINMTGKCYTDTDGRMSVIIGETGGFPNTSKMTIISLGKEIGNEVDLTKDSRKILVNVEKLLILKATCFVIEYKIVGKGAPDSTFFGSINAKGCITDVGTLEKPFSSLFKVSTYTLFGFNFDGTNTLMTMFALKKGILVEENINLQVPFEIKDVKVWAGKPSTLLITGPDQQFCWTFQEIEEEVHSDTTPYAGAGKPFNFAKPLNKIGEVSEDSSLLGGAAGEMEEDLAAGEMEEDA